VIGLAAGWLAGQFACPIVKRIWTPSWALWSGGWVLLMLAAFLAVVDALGWRRWAFPLTVVGMNSITMYMMSQLTSSWFRETLSTHGMRECFAGNYGPMWQRCSVLLTMWLVLYWLFRQKIFLKI
jgi:predicted acyltransferase